MRKVNKSRAIGSFIIIFLIVAVLAIYKSVHINHPNFAGLTFVGTEANCRVLCISGAMTTFVYVGKGSPPELLSDIDQTFKPLGYTSDSYDAVDSNPNPEDGISTNYFTRSGRQVHVEVGTPETTNDKNYLHIPCDSCRIVDLTYF